MSLRIAGEKKEEVKEIYISFTDLYAKKQCWVEQKLSEGYRVFLNPKKGKPIELKFVSYQ